MGLAHVATRRRDNLATTARPPVPPPFPTSQPPHNLAARVRPHHPATRASHPPKKLRRRHTTHARARSSCTLAGFSYRPGTASSAIEFLIDFACAFDIGMNFRTGCAARLGSPSPSLGDRSEIDRRSLDIQPPTAICSLLP